MGVLRALVPRPFLNLLFASLIAVIAHESTVVTIIIEQKEEKRFHRGGAKIVTPQALGRFVDLLADTYRVSQQECARLREGVHYVKVYRYNPKHLCPKLNGYGDNGQRSLKL